MMTKRMNWRGLAVALMLAQAVSLSLGCDEAEDGAEAETEAPDSPEPSAPEQAETQPSESLPTAAAIHVERALGAYERIRAALVEDSGEVAAPARELAEAAREAAADAPAGMRPHLSAMASEASKLAEAPDSDLASLRRQFGDLSRVTVGLLSAHRPLAKGLHVFECGMADGYDKWVQRSNEIANPYMGSRMPACGSPSSLDAT